MNEPLSFLRRWGTALAAAALTAGTALVGPVLGPADATPSAPLILAPAHHPPAGSLSATHGGGGGTSYGWSSSNWSGYAVQTTSASPFNSVSGSWTVPAVTKPKRGNSGYSSAWVGLDGFFNSPSSLIQTGTEQDFYYGSGHYSAWWTSQAQGYQEQVITSGCSWGGTHCGSVTPGDVMTASVTRTGSITLSDGSSSHGWGFSTGIAYTGPGLSAEWILEAPSSTSGVLPLANYGSAAFDPGTVNGSSNPGFVAGDGGYLVQNGAVRSIPSVPDSDTDGFTAAYGSTPPPPPNS